MATKDSSDPATKKDLKRIVEGTIRHMETRLTKKIADLKTELKTSDRATAKEVMHHFNLVVENLKYDFNGIFSDRTEQHSDKPRRSRPTVANLAIMSGA